MYLRSRLTLTLLGLAFAMHASAITPTAAGTSPDPMPYAALTEQGWVEGFQTSAGSVAYLGLPFAMPPIGDLRWQPPKPIEAWLTVVRQAASFAPPCPQVDSNGTAFGSEDCLYLNVWTPISATESSKLPVMVFMHGGGNIQGSASIEHNSILMYDGQRLAERGQVVVVTIQYRLGALGFLAHSSLVAESQEGLTGNYGLLDQIAALGWVQRNIAAFGGDPQRTLLFGESAGALDTCMLLTSPLAKGLFSRALMQSGGCNAKSAAERLKEGHVFAAKAGCARARKPADCLRKLDAATLVAAVDGSAVSPMGLVTPAFGPTVDGYVLPADPLTTIEQGQHHPVPFVIGANADETSAFGVPLTLSKAQYQATIRSLFGALADQVLAQYPVSAYESPRKALIAVTTDSQFVCPARRIAQTVAKHQTAPVYRYFYRHALNNRAGQLNGAAHGAELLFVFQHLSESPDYQPTADDLRLEAAILGYWTRFAATGDPNGGNAVVWPIYSVDVDPYLDLATPVQAAAGVRTQQCDFWQGLIPVDSTDIQNSNH
jgi:para-nitrobenzyl esterase